MSRSIDWTLEDNMVDSLFFCVTLTGHRGSNRVGVGVKDENAEACGIVRLH